MIVQHRCQDMFILRVGKISTGLGTQTEKKSRAKQERETGKNLCIIFSSFLHEKYHSEIAFST